MSRLFTIILCLILSAILGFFLVWPQYQKFSDERWRVVEKKAEMENQEEYYDHVESLSKEMENYKEQKKKIFSALPSNPDTPALLNFIANAGSNNGISLEKINSFSILSPADKSKKTPNDSGEQESTAISNIKEINIDFDASGNYAALKSFIGTLERSARIIEVDSISLKKDITEKNIEASPSYSFKIKAYYY